MRTLLPIAVVLALAPQAHAEKRDARDIASSWLDAAREGNTKQLVAVSAPEMRLQQLTASLGLFCRGTSLLSHAELRRRADDIKLTFAEPIDWKATEKAADMPVCPRNVKEQARLRGKRFGVLAAHRGEQDVSYEGAGIQIVVRVSKDGKVVFVSKTTLEGDL